MHHECTILKKLTFPREGDIHINFVDLQNLNPTFYAKLKVKRQN